MAFGCLRRSPHLVQARLEQLLPLDDERRLESEAAETARLHALLDGMVVQLLARPARMSPQQAQDILVQHLAELCA